MDVTWGSAVYAPGTYLIAEAFDVSLELSTLDVYLMLFDFGVEPLSWAPLSEVYGRLPAVLMPYFVSAVFVFGTAIAKDIQTVLTTRFFGGLFGSAPIPNTSGVPGGLRPSQSRGVAMVCYSIAVVGGPVLGPIVGAVTCESFFGWR
ncbi:hypothetical protein W97_02816 [Coniosporium apollinis CBS 100218]|uniref:Major facilitator superfamily (MFS) profile domain-containing protein n=1 Tax=Coniosporium apollinis (strain CBS 100218) TaxID=1168221 RepID=R7YP28_CONA1|nr:uncharacterized protein W97_02816 [Coniosporium apollinis CBS 100218]EON63588.1 hypothetical protein W97_02816 [Coniosporium apollinis CBS 100218]